MKFRLLDMFSVIEDDREADVKADSGEDGRVVTLEGGCCRIRRKPDAPGPCSCSWSIGDLPIFSKSFGLPPSIENRILVADFAASVSRLPVLRFLGIDIAIGGTNVGEMSFDIVSRQRLAS